jgi:hypothetical protein
MKLAGVFTDADMRSGYDGLSVLASKRGIDLKNLPKGECVAFINTSQNKIKVCTQNDVVAYHRSTRGKIDLRVVQFLPEYFDGSRINYDAALERVMRKAFPRWFKKTE